MACALPVLAACAGDEAVLDDPIVPVEQSGLRETLKDSVVVTLVDFEIQMPDTLAAGFYVFHVTNSGSAPHGFEIEGDDAVFQIGRIAPGQSGRLEAELAPGLYTVYCPVGNHAGARGMTLQLVVTARL
jgi:uncharacterized cupredoxin-like copper-binding protein